MDDQEKVAKGVEKGIKSEKTKESLSVFMVIGLVPVAILIGQVSAVLGLIVLLAGLFGIWKFYTR